MARTKYWMGPPHLKPKDWKDAVPEKTNTESSDTEDDSSVPDHDVSREQESGPPVEHLISELLKLKESLLNSAKRIDSVVNAARETKVSPDPTKMPGIHGPQLQSRGTWVMGPSIYDKDDLIG